MTIVYIRKHRAAKIAKRIVGIDDNNRWQELDDVFLHRNQIKIGTELMYYGRIDHGSIWRIIEIKTYSPGGKATKVDTIRNTKDAIVLLRVGTNETHQINFIYLSYSAIWRLFR